MKAQHVGDVIKEGGLGALDDLILVICVPWWWVFFFIFLFFSIPPHYLLFTLFYSPLAFSLLHIFLVSSQKYLHIFLIILLGLF